MASLEPDDLELLRGENYAWFVTLDPDATSALTEEQKNTRVQEIVDEVNRERSRFEQIKRFVILSRDFSMDEGEVTPTLKLKRRVILQKYAREIEEMYERDERRPVGVTAKLSILRSPGTAQRIVAVQKLFELVQVVRIASRLGYQTLNRLGFVEM